MSKGRLFLTGVLLFILIIMAANLFNNIEMTSEYSVIDKNSGKHELVVVNPEGIKLAIRVNEGYIDLIEVEKSYIMTINFYKWKSPKLKKITKIQ
ncbi:hypothetical protein [Paenibacillus sp. YYML68]|uniref:hypothetical protein n=1 Tax=Paenibacillus sp. YYML68 TaxID=2909250 RepID=UPI002491F76D|nr:hypothetical protein [Paenibacillus sp. YYML68]